MKHGEILKISVFAVLAFASSARADVPHALSYDDAVRIALEDNVDLLALRDQEESFQHQAKQALAPNEPTFTFMKNDIPSFTLSKQAAQTVYQLNWTLGFPGKALSNSASIRHQSEAADEQAKNQEITIMTSLSNSYVSFATNQAFYQFLLDEQQKNKELVKLIEKKYAASQASKVDLLNAEVATQQIAQAILENRNDYEILLTQFRQLIRRPADRSLIPQVQEKIEIPVVKQSFDELIPIMLRNNHAVLGSQKTVDSQSALLTSASLQALPDFQLTAAVNDWLPSGAPNPGITRDYTAGIAVVVPIFFPLNELQGVHAARSSLDAAQNQAASQQLQAVSGLQAAYTSLQATLRDLDTSEKLVVPAAKASFDLTLMTYGLGKADYFVLNESRKAWHDAERDMLTKRQAAAQFYNQLVAQMGCDIAQSEGTHACK